MNNLNQKNCDQLTVKVKFLDDHVDIFAVNMNGLGSELFQKVSIKAKLIESYFFGLSFLSTESDLCWLDLRKAIRKQVNIFGEYMYDFCVKFYSPDPNLLQDSLTKQLFILQLKMDLSKGELICCDSTRILLGAFFLQLFYPGSLDQDTSTLRSFLKQLFNESSTSSNLIDQALDFYKTLKDQSIEDTQYDLLETARKIDFYGMKMHPAKDIDGIALTLAVHHLGIVVFQKYAKINTFNWSKIRKLSFKRKRFLIKLHSEEYLELFILWVVQGFYKDTLEFYFDTRNSCKNFWKKCIEHHAFFRSKSSRQARQSTVGRLHGFRRNFSGSRFRYVGLTQLELDQTQHHSGGRNNHFHRSESAGRLIPRDSSFTRWPATNSPTKSDSINCLSLTMEPSPIDSFDGKTIISNSGNSATYSENHYPGANNVSLNLFGIYNNTRHFRSETEVFSLKCTETEIRSYGNDSLADGKYPNATASIISGSFSVKKDIDVNAEKLNLIQSRTINYIFDSYEFIPKLLSQVLLSEECPNDFNVNINLLGLNGEELINGASNTRLTVSTSINSDIFPYFSVLNSVMKDFLFNEFTHVKEMQVLKEILDSSSPIQTQIISHLNKLLSATKTLIIKLEIRVKINTQSIDNFPASANHFLMILNEYFSQTLEVFHLYFECVECILQCMMDQNSEPVCLKYPQLQHLTKSQFHMKNPLRLLLSVIFRQRDRHKCLVIINDFLLNTEKDQIICQNIISRIKSTIVTIPLLEEDAQQLLLAAYIDGLQRNRPRRFGWLQRLSRKGVTNRLFVVTSKELMCIKKLQSNIFLLEQSWSLTNIRLGTISEFSSCPNGHSFANSSLEILTIILFLDNPSLEESANLIMLADSKTSQALWISEINNAKKELSTESNSEGFFNKLRSDWSQDYQLLDACWHDRISMSWDQARFIFQLVLSSYILRRYKVSSTWQRLWVVLADYHLFFYKDHTDREAITSLSLLSFRVCEPKTEDSIDKDWVIKLMKDSKTYFLRTENQYFYLRWKAALQYCTSFSN